MKTIVFHHLNLCHTYLVFTCMKWWVPAGEALPRSACLPSPSTSVFLQTRKLIFSLFGCRPALPHQVSLCHSARSFNSTRCQNQIKAHGFCLAQVDLALFLGSPVPTKRPFFFLFCHFLLLLSSLLCQGETYHRG